MIARPVSAIKRNKASAPKVQARAVSIYTYPFILTTYVMSARGAQIARRLPLYEETRLRRRADPPRVRSQIRSQHEDENVDGYRILRLPQRRLRVSYQIISHFNLTSLYSKAMQVYDELIKRGEQEQQLYVFKACCMYALG